MAKKAKRVTVIEVPKKKRKMTAKRIQKKAVKKALQSSVIVKRHAFAGIDRLMPFGTSPNGLNQGTTFKVFYPLAMAKSSSNTNADDFNNRESNRINARNCQFWCNVQPRPTQLEPFQVVIRAGYFKGDDNLGTGQLTPAALKVLYPEANSLPYTKNTGQRDFYWKHTKVYTMCPKQLYDGVDEYPGADDQSEVNRALWLPKDIKYNFRFNRLFDYETDEGDALNGWVPLITIQCMPLEGGTAFTRPDIETDIDGNGGSYPCPILHCSMVTYFNDCH